MNTLYLKAILWGGAIAGTLDLLAAFISNGLRGRDPVWVMHIVASGWLGEAAFTGGAASAVLGVLSHYSILFIAAALYVTAGRGWDWLQNHPLPCGALYGIGIYFFMNFVVLPLSAFPYQIQYTPRVLAIGLLIHVFCVGLPIAYAAYWYRSNRA